jgi:hypothetical protein
MNNVQLAKKEQELTKLSDKIRAKGYSLETERSYCGALGRFIDYLCARSWSVSATAEDKVEQFLTAQGRRDIAAATQNAMFHAICFYYREVRKVPLQNVDALRAKRGEQVRQAPSKEDTRKLLTIVAGKGKVDRFITLPPSLIERLRLQVRAAESVQKRAVAEGVPVKLPHRYGEKNPQSAFQRRWFWLFPQNQPCVDPRGAGRVWWHCLDVTVQRAMRTGNRRAGTEGITPHCLRHAWATHAADDGAQLRDLQVVLGHRNIETTARYVRPNPERVPSPLEGMGMVA